MMVAAMAAWAQTPQHVHQGATAANPNGFPFSAGLNKTQWLYRGSLFPSLPSGNITRLYFKSASTTTSTLSNLEIRIAPTSLSAFPSTTAFETTGFTTVFSAATHVVTAQTGQWFEVALQTPFPYTAGQNFIVEVTKTGATNQILAYQTDEAYLSRLHASSATALVPTGNMNRVAELGIDITAGTTVTISGPDTICIGSSNTFFGTPAGGTWSSSNTGVATINAAGVATAVSNGSATITYNSGSGTVTKTLYVQNTVQPTIHLAVTPGDTICYGGNLSFTATVTNAGSNPNYTWRIGGQPLVVPHNNPVLPMTMAPAGQYTVSCILTSSLACAITDTAEVRAVVLPAASASVSVSANPTGPLCAGTPVTFTAVPVNGGSNPAYQWKKNNNTVGTNNAAYTDATLTATDVITCEMTGNARCASPTVTASSPLSVNIGTPVVPVVVITANDTAVCAQERVNLSVAATGGGTAPAYQWYVNNVATGNGSSQHNYAPVQSDKVFCMMTSNLPCPTPGRVTTDTLTFTVFSLPSATITQAGSTFTSSAATGNQWLLGGAPITGANGRTHTATQSGYYKVRITDANGCSGTSDSVYYQHNVSVAQPDFDRLVQVFPNPASDRIILQLQLPSAYLQNSNASIVNQLGQSVLAVPVSAGNNTINIAQLPAGVYFLKLQLADYSKVFSITKQ